VYRLGVVADGVGDIAASVGDPQEGIDDAELGNKVWWVYSGKKGLAEDSNDALHGRQLVRRFHLLDQPFK
jgi:hypothetical protein